MTFMLRGDGRCFGLGRRVGCPKMAKRVSLTSRREKAEEISSQYLTINVADCLSCSRHYLLSLHSIFSFSQSGREISNTQSRRQDPLLDDGGGWHDIQKSSLSFLVEEIVIGNNSSGKQSPFYWLRSCQILFMIELTIFIAAADGCWLRYSRHRLEILLPFLAEFLHHMPHCSAESWAKDKHTHQREWRGSGGRGQKS